MDSGSAKDCEPVGGRTEPMPEVNVCVRSVRSCLLIIHIHLSEQNNWYP